MKTYLRTLMAGTCLIWGFTQMTYSQPEQKPESPPDYQFTVEKRIPATPVKDQHNTGTCWSFATTSFIESELLRTGQGETDLSEMFFVRKAYERKAEKYVRMHGTINFERGGLAMDVLELWKESGMMPQEAYPGDRMGDSLPVHGEMDAVLRGYVDQVIKNRNHKLTPVWKDGFNGILDAYLGKVPESFSTGGHSQTPRSFADNTGLDPDDYVAVGSFTHHPFYERFILEIPDNWNWGSIYNVPLDEMMELLEVALSKGYSVCWDADMSEKGYNWDKGVATFPGPVTQENRQHWFDNYQTTDDHLEHIIGLARDQEGNRFYLVKNSWGSGHHIYEGFHYVSETYMRAKTLFLMVHRDAVPPSMAKRLNL
ncbi:MAG: C1 family peptidase [Bacteroidales bacterium]